MKIKTVYEFVGDTDEGLGYVKGSEYSLTVVQRSLSDRLWAFTYGVPFSWKIVIVRPIMVPYKNRGAFEANWKHKYTRVDG